MAKMRALKTKYFSGIGTVNPGDVFEIGEQHVRALQALGIATTKLAEDDPSLMPTYRSARMQPQPVPEPERVEEASDQSGEEVRREHVIMALRTRAAALGIEVDGRWGEERLRRELAEASRYDRRDMQARE